MKLWHKLAIGAAAFLAVVGALVGTLLAVGVIRPNPATVAVLSVYPSGSDLIVQVAPSDFPKGSTVVSVKLPNGTTVSQTVRDGNVPSPRITFPSIISGQNATQQRPFVVRAYRKNSAGFSGAWSAPVTYDGSNLSH